MDNEMDTGVFYVCIYVYIYIDMVAGTSTTLE